MEKQDQKYEVSFEYISKYCKTVGDVLNLEKEIKKYETSKNN